MQRKGNLGSIPGGPPNILTLDVLEAKLVWTKTGTLNF
jgi:hypothetical protein